MNRRKPCAVLFFNAIKALAICLTMVLCVGGCASDPEEDLSIGEITIYNIPATIPIDDNSGGFNETLMVYFYASNHMDDNELPEARGYWKLTPQPTGTHTVTIPLFKRYPTQGCDPHDRTSTDPWFGTSNFFSVMISPRAPANVNYIYAKAGVTLNKGKSSINWGSLMDLRLLNMPARSQALYNTLLDASNANDFWPDLQ